MEDRAADDEVGPRRSTDLVEVLHTSLPELEIVVRMPCGSFEHGRIRLDTDHVTPRHHARKSGGELA